MRDLEAFEPELHTLGAAAEREALGQELARFAVEVPASEVEGKPYRRVLRCEQSYVSAAGPLRGERTRYAQRQQEARALCPLELRAGGGEGHGTPLAAKQATWVVAPLTPQEGEELFAMLGNMLSSTSSWERLPQQLSARWEPQRQQCEPVLQQQEAVPEQAAPRAVSLDGVMVPMKDGGRAEKRAGTAARGQHTRGPAGPQEAGWATISYYDAAGERLCPRRMARMPEGNKRTLQELLTAEVTAALTARPDLGLGKLADGAPDNWSSLADALPPGQELGDFYHAAAHLHAALGAAYGETSPACTAQFEKLPRVLRDDPRGVDTGSRSLRHLRDRDPRRQKSRAAGTYVRHRRHRLRSAQAQAHHRPIGSGGVEAAGKTLVTQRMKHSGMRWRHAGGQASLTFRALLQSDRFDRAWHLLSGTYRREVKLPHRLLH